MQTCISHRVASWRQRGLALAALMPLSSFTHALSPHPLTAAEKQKVVAREKHSLLLLVPAQWTIARASGEPGSVQPESCEPAARIPAVATTAVLPPRTPLNDIDLLRAAAILCDVILSKRREVRGQDGILRIHLNKHFDVSSARFFEVCQITPSVFQRKCL